MRFAVRDQVLEKRRLLRPTSLAKQSVQRHQSRHRHDPDRRARNEERRIPRDILFAQRAERNPEVEVERLEVTGCLAIRRRNDEVADQAQRVVTVRGDAFLDELCDLANAAAGVSNADRIQTKPDSRRAENAPVTPRLLPCGEDYPRRFLRGRPL